MAWRERLKKDDFLVVAEVLPPKGTDLGGWEERLVPMKGRVEAVYLPSLQGGVMRMSSWAAAKYLQERGYETIFEVSCAHENRVALQAELLGAWSLGLQNVVAVEGDDPSLGDHPESKGVFDIGVLELLGGIKRLQEGYDMSGGDVQGAPSFCVGTKVDASLRGDALEEELRGMEEKVGLGVEFFITTSVYDLRQLEAFTKRAHPLGVPIIAGLMVLKSAGMARYINKHVKGVMIPEEIITKLMKAPDKIAASIEIAAETIRGIRGLCQGVNIVPIGWEDKVPAILDEARA